MSISEKIIECAAEKRLFKTFFSKINTFFIKVFNKMNEAFIHLFEPVDLYLSRIARNYIVSHNKTLENKVLFMTFNNNYACNPKYICEELARQNLPIDLVWATSQRKIDQASYKFNPKLRLVKRASYQFFKEAASAKVWVDNAICFPMNPIQKQEGQFYVQTWHGSMGLKRIGKNDVKDPKWVAAAAKENEWVDICMSNSTFETQVFRDTHWPDVPIIETGHARNDIFFWDEKEKQSIREKVLDYYRLNKDVKIVLYGPTFREGDEDVYTLDYSKLLDFLEKFYGGDWILLNRFHFKSKDGKQQTFDDRRIVKASGYYDMQELMIAADIGITDYSSWICDYVLSKRPAFIYASDYEAYKNNERGFYYPLETTPFPIAENTDQLIEAIRAFDEAEYVKKCDQFLEDRGCKEQGDAAKKIVEIIKEKCLGSDEAK